MHVTYQIEFLTLIVSEKMIVGLDLYGLDSSSFELKNKLKLCRHVTRRQVCGLLTLQCRLHIFGIYLHYVDDSAGSTQ